MNALVFTDLDGTLLDHHSYSYAPARPGIEALELQQIPIVPVSSKTRAEIEPLMAELGWRSPFIVENGAAVFIPDPLVNPSDTTLPRLDGYRVQAFAPTVAEWEVLIMQLAAELPGAFSAFSQMTTDRIAALTGLSPQQAEYAAKREFSDPLYWQGNDDQFAQLQAICAEQQVSVVRGGRFVHLLKGSDKGRAVQWLTQWYAEHQGAVPVTIALGDGENDLSMLAAVEYAVQIRPANGEFPEFTHSECYRTRNAGPEGWSEAIAHLLARLI